tara:strand:- start:1172 stop:1684 length:513 start_codon:yes stop_codon:yes gene_type:complete
MDEVILTLKPSAFNALVPIFLKRLFYSILISVVLLLIYLVLNWLGIFDYTLTIVIILLLSLSFIFSLISLVWRFIVLYNTNYYFTKAGITHEFELFKIKRTSVAYHQIVNFTVDISLWDRLSKAGDIHIHTSEGTPDITLQFIKLPHEVETKIHQIMDACIANDQTFKKF